MQSNTATTKIVDFPSSSSEKTLSAYWTMIIGGRLTPQAESLLSWWALELGDESVYYAIDETALAPRPSIRYTIAILRRLAAEKAEKAEKGEKA